MNWTAFWCLANLMFMFWSISDHDAVWAAFSGIAAGALAMLYLVDRQEQRDA